MACVTTDIGYKGRCWWRNKKLQNGAAQAHELPASPGVLFGGQQLLLPLLGWKTKIQQVNETKATELGRGLRGVKGRDPGASLLVLVSALFLLYFLL